MDPDSLPSAQLPWLLIGGVVAGVTLIIVAIIAVIIIVCCLKVKSKDARASHKRFYDYPYGATAQTDSESSDAEMNRYRSKSMATKKNEAYNMKARRPTPFEEDEHIYDRLSHSY
jgi:uncharacterized membrane protein YccF (DUF307 family)